MHLIINIDNYQVNCRLASINKQLYGQIKDRFQTLINTQIYVGEPYGRNEKVDDEELNEAPDSTTEKEKVFQCMISVVLDKRYSMFGRYQFLIRYGNQLLDYLYDIMVSQYMTDFHRYDSSIRGQMLRIAYYKWRFVREYWLAPGGGNSLKDFREIRQIPQNKFIVAYIQCLEHDFDEIYNIISVDDYSNFDSMEERRDWINYHQLNYYKKRFGKLPIV